MNAKICTRCSNETENEGICSYCWADDVDAAYYDDLCWTVERGPSSDKRDHLFSFEEDAHKEGMCGSSELTPESIHANRDDGGYNGVYPF